MKEPTIVINGTTLSDAAAMTLRVALGNFQIDLCGELGKDLGELGITYRGIANQIGVIMQAPRLASREKSSPCSHSSVTRYSREEPGEPSIGPYVVYRYQCNECKSEVDSQTYLKATYKTTKEE